MARGEGERTPLIVGPQRRLGIPMVSTESPKPPHLSFPEALKSMRVVPDPERQLRFDIDEILETGDSVPYGEDLRFLDSKGGPGISDAEVAKWTPEERVRFAQIKDRFKRLPNGGYERLAHAWDIAAPLREETDDSPQG